MASPSILERAFEIAESGSARSVEEVRRQLKSERFDQVETHLGGTSIRKQIRELIEARLKGE